MPSAPNPALFGRYAATLEGGRQHYWCQDHPEQPLISLPVSNNWEPESLAAITQAIREHDEQQHEEDRRA